MSQVIGREALLFLLAAGWGAALLVVYDLLRAFRRAVAHGYAAIAAEDLLYWAMAGIGTFILVFVENDGVFRGYLLLGIGLGMTLYHYTVSELLTRLLALLLRLAVTALGLPIRALSRAAAGMARPVVRLARKIAVVFFAKKRRKNLQKVVEKGEKNR